jgi:succinoglycan biosynthesis protein ExoA
MNDRADVRVSIIAACRNEAGHIVSLLDSLLEQDLNGMCWEAIIADGMSDDGTRAVLDTYAARHRELRVVSNPGRIASTGLNAAIRVARGQYVLRLDAHTCYARDYCWRSVAALERTGADNVGGPARMRAQGVRAQAVAAAYHSPFSTGGARFHDPNFEGWVDTVPYGCWRKTTLEELGLFDETLVRNQDDELNLRLVRAGGRVWQDPAIVSWYSPRATLWGLFRQYLQYGFWKVAVIRKHRIPGSWRHLMPAAFVLANALLPAAIGLTALASARQTSAAVAAIWLAMLAAYGVAAVVASLAAASRAGWATLPYLPVVFATYHFSYGLGFLAGMCRFGTRPEWAVGAESAFCRITR